MMIPHVALPGDFELVQRQPPVRGSAEDIAQRRKDFSILVVAEGEERISSNRLLGKVYIILLQPPQDIEFRSMCAPAELGLAVCALVVGSLLWPADAPSRRVLLLRPSIVPSGCPIKLSSLISVVNVPW